MKPIIKIIGKDGKGWSIDKDRFYHKKALKELNYRQANTTMGANIIYNVWYSYILKKKFALLRRFKGKRKLINVITNDPEDNHCNLKLYKSFTDYWVCANHKQKQFLLTQKVHEAEIFINPFYVDELIFKDLGLTKEVLVEKLNLTAESIVNKYIIGSFQRDSRGDDVLKSKWHKNPERMINILKSLDASKYTLLLAGPRRHFVINECRKHKIPYLFVGDESYIDKNKDDVFKNNISFETINMLYNLCDLYLLTSDSEGGPKAVIEAGLTKTPILSTPVGFATDLLNQESICTSVDEFKFKTESFINTPETVRLLVQKNYENVSKINNFEAYKQRIKHIIETVSNG